MQQEVPLFLHLLPSFCETASANISYTFFMAYDYDDRLLSKQSGLERFTDIFNNIVKGPDCQGGFKVDLRFVHCNDSGHPAYAQNDALVAAYAANMDYLHMVNDDTDMITPGWTEPFIKKLSLFDPPNVGLFCWPILQGREYCWPDI